MKSLIGADDPHSPGSSGTRESNLTAKYSVLEVATVRQRNYSLNDGDPRSASRDYSRANSDQHRSRREPDSLFIEGTALPRRASRPVIQASVKSGYVRDCSLGKAQKQTRQHAGMILSFLRNDPLRRIHVNNKNIILRSSYDSTTPDSQGYPQSSADSDEE